MKVLVFSLDLRLWANLLQYCNGVMPLGEPPMVSPREPRPGTILPRYLLGSYARGLTYEKGEECESIEIKSPSENWADTGKSFISYLKGAYPVLIP